MSFSEIDDVEVIPHTCSITVLKSVRRLLRARIGNNVRSGVVVAEDLQRRRVDATDSHVCEKRKKILGASLGMLSDLT
jgi:hypothetical protein